MYYGSEQDDPAFFTEGRRPHPPRTPLEREIAEAESAVAEFAEKEPDVEVSVLRCANVLGPDVDTAFTRIFSLPLVPMVLGFDPRLQFVHEDDVVHALEHRLQRRARRLQRRGRRGPRPERGDLAALEAPGAGAAAVGNRPPGGAAAEPWLPDPQRDAQPPAVRPGVDNRRLQAAGFRYGHTSRETVAKFGHHLRVTR